jgi:hypothetical protein
MRKRAIVLMVMAVVVLSALPAQAAPWQHQWLPDADLFCQDDGGRVVDVGAWVGNPNAGTLWVAEGPFAGHYLMVTTEHYFAPGLGDTPLQEGELAQLPPPEVRTFGRKLGRADRVTCQVVSRFEAYDFTVYAPMVLARVR